MGESSQNMKVLNYMRTHQGITSMDAFRKLGITRLSARIHDLRDAGFTITMLWETSESGSRYGRYYLEGEHE